MEEHPERLHRLEQALQTQVTLWRLHPVGEALQALHGVPVTVAMTLVAAIGDLTRFDTPRELMQFLSLIPSEYTRNLPVLSTFMAASHIRHNAGPSALYISLASIDGPIGLYGIDKGMQPLVALPDGLHARLAVPRPG